MRLSALCYLILALAVVTSASAQTAKAPQLAQLPDLRLISSSMGKLSTKPTPDANPVRTVQGYQCRACRRLCARDRNYCYDSPGRCQRTFIRCMRICWYDYCRR